MTLPTILTLARILLTAPICGLIVVDTATALWWALGLFILAAVTDFLDGFIARRFDLASDLGRMLDSIADKLLIAAVVVVLVAVDRIGGWSVMAAVVIICRELFISGMREHWAGRKIVLKVSWTAKWKTTVQMLAVAALIIAPVVALPGPIGLSQIGTVGLWLSAVLSVSSAFAYARAGFRATAAPPSLGGQPAKRADPSREPG